MDKEQYVLRFWDCAQQNHRLFRKDAVRIVVLVCGIDDEGISSAVLEYTLEALNAFVVLDNK